MISFFSTLTRRLEAWTRFHDPKQPVSSRRSNGSSSEKKTLRFFLASDFFFAVEFRPMIWWLKLDLFTFLLEKDLYRIIAFRWWPVQLSTPNCSWVNDRVGVWFLSWPSVRQSRVIAGSRCLFVSFDWPKWRDLLDPKLTNLVTDWLEVARISGWSSL